MTPPSPYIKRYLMTAGPTPLPPRVSQVMAEPVAYHRSPAFDALFASVLARLPEIFQTANDVLLYTSSGTGALESAVANLVRPGRPVLACAAGKFGQRWTQLCEAYGAHVVPYEEEWGARLDPAEIDRLLGEHPEIDVCFTTLSETSTGVVHDIEAIAAVARAHDVMLAVDAVSGLGAAELRQDAWGVDVVVAGSQKALMAPPGLAFASVSERALEYSTALPAPVGSYYFNWARTAKAQRGKAPASPFTPAVTLIAALDVALDMILAEGLQNVLARHALLAQATRAGAAALGIERFGDPDERANVVTAIEFEPELGGRLPGLLRDRYGIIANGGQDHLKGRILRIAHCGYFGAFDILTTLSALELALSELGQEVELGAGVGAAQRVFHDAGIAVAPAS